MIVQLIYNELQELGNYLIDIHSQFQTRNIINEEYQIDLLDKVATNESNYS